MVRAATARFLAELAVAARLQEGALLGWADRWLRAPRGSAETSHPSRLVPPLRPKWDDEMRANSDICAALSHLSHSRTARLNPYRKMYVPTHPTLRVWL